MKRLDRKEAEGAEYQGGTDIEGEGYLLSSQRAVEKGTLHRLYAMCAMDVVCAMD